VLSSQYSEGRVFRREFESEFEVGLCWGYENYIRLTQLHEEGYCHRELDFIEVHLKVAPTSYYHAATDQLALLTHKRALSRTQHQTLQHLRASLLLKDPPETASDLELAPDPLPQRTD
jgi:hypothetical protein